MVGDRQCLEDSERKDHWLNKLINEWVTEVIVEQPRHNFFVAEPRTSRLIDSIGLSADSVKNMV